jgi:hypothetical protein
MLVTCPLNETRGDGLGLWGFDGVRDGETGAPGSVVSVEGVDEVGVGAKKRLILFADEGRLSF